MWQLCRELLSKIRIKKFFFLRKTLVSELCSWMCDGKCHSLLLTFVTIIMLLNVELNEALYIYRLDYPVALITFFVALREDDQS